MCTEGLFHQGKPSNSASPNHGTLSSSPLLSLVLGRLCSSSLSNGAVSFRDSGAGELCPDLFSRFRETLLLIFARPRNSLSISPSAMKSSSLLLGSIVVIGRARCRSVLGSRTRAGGGCGCGEYYDRGIISERLSPLEAELGAIRTCIVRKCGEVSRLRSHLINLGRLGVPYLGDDKLT